MWLLEGQTLILAIFLEILIKVNFLVPKITFIDIETE